MGKKKVTTNWLSFNIDMPDALIPLYNYLQSELDVILSDTKYRKQLLNIDLSKHRGNIWRDMRDLFRDRVNTWPIRNKTWYSYMLYENLRRELQSKAEATIIYNTLKTNNNVINEELMGKLHTKHIYSTFARISNIQRSKNKPKLPQHVVFNMDYSVSAAQNFTMDRNNHCRIQLLDGSWLDYDIYLPTSLHKTLTGKIAKPRFIKRKRDNQYIGLCSFEYTPYPNNNDDNVLGVDIGQVKLFTAIALKPNGLYGNEYIESAKTRHLQNKLNKLYTVKQNLNNKINDVDSFLATDESYKQTKRLVEHNEISNKIINLKTVISRNMAKEVISVAVSEKCKEIHIENLSWMGSLGGKWNHEQIHDFIIEQARKYSIKVVKVNARYTSGTNPITGELGNKNNRTVTFRDTKKIDRDTLAAINIASRNRGNQKNNHVKYLKHKATPSLRVKTTKSRKQEIKQIIKQINRDTEIVVFCPQQRTLFSERLWSVTDSNYQTNNSLLTCLYKCANLLHY